MRILIKKQQHNSKIRMQKSSKKNKMGSNTSKHVAAAGTYSIPNLDGRMTFLRIYSKLSVILRQWWSSRIKISMQTNYANRRKYVKKLWKLMSVVWNILDQFLKKNFWFDCFVEMDCMYDFKSFQSSFGLFLSLHHLQFLHWCFTHTLFFLYFFFLCFNLKISAFFHFLFLFSLGCLALLF